MIGRDARINLLISTGHFLSHFYQLCLPPLFLVWQRQFDISFAELGLSVVLMTGTAAVLQTPVGFLIDRYGARPFLIGGALVMSLAIALMAFETDPIQRTGPRTLHGWIHDVAFVLFVIAVLAAFIFLWRRLRKDPSWRGHARYTLVTGVLAALLLLLPGVAYYLFLLAVLAWFEVTALRLWRIQGP